MVRYGVYIYIYTPFIKYEMVYNTKYVQMGKNGVYTMGIIHII